MRMCTRLMTKLVTEERKPKQLLRVFKKTIHGKGEEIKMT